MPPAARFLLALGRALEARLDGPGADLARGATERQAWERLDALVREDPAPRFRFSPRGVEYGDLPLHELAEWEWAPRLAALGVGCLMATAPVPQASLTRFLDTAAEGVRSGQHVPDMVTDGLAWGRGDHGVVFDAELPPIGALAPDLFEEELAVVASLFARAARGEPFGPTDPSAVVAALQVAMRAEGALALPLIRPTGRDDYQPAHALNTAILALALAEALQLGREEARQAGLAALVHDLGMARVPPEALASETLTTADRARVRNHPVEGARLLLRLGEGWELAAVAAYEHHLRPDGTGYPRMSYPREAHFLSRMIAVCDTFDALRAPRPDRPAFEAEPALLEIERVSGTQFDPRVVPAFGRMIREALEQGALP
jgi:HD-GYP domain-containing protein (c-di-GMP phosphodiesterase class II)